MNQEDYENQHFGNTFLVKNMINAQLKAVKFEKTSQNFNQIFQNNDHNTIKQNRIFKNWTQRDSNLHTIFYLKETLKNPILLDGWSLSRKKQFYLKMSRLIKSKSNYQARAYDKLLKEQNQNHFSSFFDFLLDKAKKLSKKNQEIEILLNKLVENKKRVDKHMSILKVRTQQTQNTTNSINSLFQSIGRY